MKRYTTLLLLCAALASAKNLRKISKDDIIIAQLPDDKPTVVDTPEDGSTVVQIPEDGPSVVDIPTGGQQEVDATPISFCDQREYRGQIFPHENCNQFYLCSRGISEVFTCPANLLYNPETKQCDWSFNVECGDRIVPEGIEVGAPEEEAAVPEEEEPVPEETPEPEEEESAVEDDESSSEVNVVDNNPDNEEQDVSGSDCEESALSLHENCNQFYICAHGIPVALSCPGELLYDPESESCQWPSSVDCGGRIIPDEPEKPDSVEEVLTTPAPLPESPTVESEEDNNNIEGDSRCRYNGQILPNENCNQFSLCAHGLPVTMSCPEELLFNSETNVCDWPKNVECGDRIVPETEVDDDDDEIEIDSEVDIVDVVPESDLEEADEESAPDDVIESTEPTTQTPSPDSVSTAAPLEEEEETGEDDNGVVVIDTPSTEAPADTENEEDQVAGNDDICDLSRAFDGHAYPHEYCNQFYLCAHGTATPMLCPSILLFDTETRRCDWPRKVDCGDRIIPVVVA